MRKAYIHTAALLACVPIVSVYSQFARATSYTWVGGSSTSLTDPNNYSPSSFNQPGPNDSINFGPTYTSLPDPVVLNAGINLNIQAINDLNGAPILNLSDSGNLTLEGSGLEGAMNVGVNTAGQLNFSNASQSQSANITIASGGAVTLNDSSVAGSGTILTNNGGAITFNSNASSRATINNAGGTITLNNNATMSAGIISNSATVTFNDTASAGSGDISSSNGGSATFAGYSTAQNATLSGNVNFTGNSNAGYAQISLGASDIVTFQDSANATGSNIADNGKLIFTGGSNGSMQNLGATVTIGAAGVLDISGDTNGSPSNYHVDLNQVSGSGTIDLGSNTLRLVGNNGESTSFSGTIQNGGQSGGTGGSIDVQGENLSLSGANTYTGNTIIEAGGQINLTGSLTTSLLGFNGGNFTFSASNANTSQSIGSVEFHGGFGTVSSDIGTAANTSITFGSLVSRQTGATGGFAVMGGANGTTNKIVITNQSAGFIDPGVFFTDSFDVGDKNPTSINYAYYDNGGFVRGINYGVDANSVSAAAGATIAGSLTSATNVQLTGNITAQTTTTINTLNLGANSLTLASGQTLSLNGILQQGGSSTISGGSSLAYAGFGSESDLVIATLQKTDSLTIDTPITASALTLTGGGTLFLNNSFNGTTYIDGGTLSLGALATTNGNINVNSSLMVNGTVNGNVNILGQGTLGGSGTINGAVTVYAGGSSYPGDPRILTANTINYQSGSTAQFSIAPTSSTATNLVAGSDYDQIQLTAGTGTALTISGSTTLQLNFTSASLGIAQTRAANNLNSAYFLFALGKATSSGLFTNLAVYDGSTTYVVPIISDIADISAIHLRFIFSYTGDAALNSLTGGNDLAVTLQSLSVPEVPTLGYVAICGAALALLRRKKPQTL